MKRRHAGRARGRFRPRQEVVHNLEVALGLLGVCHVGAVLEDHPIGPRYAVVHDLHQFWSGFIVPARGEEGGTWISPRRCSMFQFLDDSDDMELTRSVHRVVDFRILASLANARLT